MLMFSLYQTMCAPQTHVYTGVLVIKTWVEEYHCQNVHASMDTPDQSVKVTFTILYEKKRAFSLKEAAVM